ncbi:hypothetical protein FA13DRAFT_1713833 [Coprinellus micaceus]|uniref:Uncharacterized protein n=1 Tax=Coprinellus micaceus TaxID=71717 RepID=A0A4Y7SVD1_COPMI|nr:hypothetical protein FA13DRAFT_1713833 [Coprinellus micaceus]
MNYGDNNSFSQIPFYNPFSDPGSGIQPPLQPPPSPFLIKAIHHLASSTLLHWSTYLHPLTTIKHPTGMPIQERRRRERSVEAPSEGPAPRKATASDDGYPTATAGAPSVWAAGPVSSTSASSSSLFGALGSASASVHAGALGDFTSSAHSSAYAHPTVLNQGPTASANTHVHNHPPYVSAHSSSFTHGPAPTLSSTHASASTHAPAPCPAPAPAPVSAPPRRSAQVSSSGIKLCPGVLLRQHIFTCKPHPTPSSPPPSDPTTTINARHETTLKDIMRRVDSSTHLPQETDAMEVRSAKLHQSMSLGDPNTRTTNSVVVLDDLLRVWFAPDFCEALTKNSSDPHRWHNEANIHDESFSGIVRALMKALRDPTSPCGKLFLAIKMEIFTNGSTQYLFEVHQSVFSLYNVAAWDAGKTLCACDAQDNALLVFTLTTLSAKLQRETKALIHAVCGATTANRLHAVFSIGRGRDIAEVVPFVVVEVFNDTIKQVVLDRITGSVIKGLQLQFITRSRLRLFDGNIISDFAKIQNLGKGLDFFEACCMYRRTLTTGCGLNAILDKPACRELMSQIAQGTQYIAAMPHASLEQANIVLKDLAAAATKGLLSLPSNSVVDKFNQRQSNSAQKGALHYLTVIYWVCADARRVPTPQMEGVFGNWLGVAIANHHVALLAWLVSHGKEDAEVKAALQAGTWTHKLLIAVHQLVQESVRPAALENLLTQIEASGPLNKILSDLSRSLEVEGFQPDVSVTPISSFQNAEPTASTSSREGQDMPSSIRGSTSAAQTITSSPGGVNEGWLAQATRLREANNPLTLQNSDDIRDIMGSVPAMIVPRCHTHLRGYRMTSIDEPRATHGILQHLGHASWPALSRAQLAPALRLRAGQLGRELGWAGPPGSQLR